MEIVICYGKRPGTTGAFLEAAFRRQGHNVQVLDLHRLRRARPNLPFRYLGREFPLLSTVDAARFVRRRKTAPGLFLWVESPRSVEVRVRRPFPCPTACYVIDTHMRSAELKRLARAYDTVFVAQRDDATAFAADGLNAHWLPLAADPELHAPVKVPVEFDVGFVGHIEAARYRERFRMLRAISQEFKVNVTTAYGREMAEAYCRCRVGFNKSLKGDLNMRVFEVMAMGVPLVTDRIGNGLDELFHEGEHYLAYSDAIELSGQVRTLCNDAALRNRIGDAARAEILRAHTYDERVGRILRTLRGGSGPVRISSGRGVGFELGA